MRGRRWVDCMGRVVTRPSDLEMTSQFYGCTPLQVIERGETGRLGRMTWQLREGNAG